MAVTSLSTLTSVLFRGLFQVFGSRVRVDAVSKVAELELAEKEKMKDKVEKIIKHGCNVFINRYASVRRDFVHVDNVFCF